MYVCANKQTMIQANELRVGNLVHDNIGGVLKIKGISTESDLTHIRPIPLTEEWLIELGFDFFLYISDNGITFRFEKIGSDWICHIDDSIILEIKYVHQLQNLYFALRGQELTIK